MQSAPLPPEEPQRLCTLYSFDVLDTDRETVFDEIAELATEICEAPIALVSFVDHSRQWFKARVGWAASELTRSVSFCAHAILQPGLFIVPDAQKDARFADNPLVIGPPHLRFYAGAPLFSEEGYGLGTLCVIDKVPRELTPQQQKALMILRTHVLKLLDLRRKTQQLANINHELETFSYTVSHDLRAPLRAITGYGHILVEDHFADLGEPARNLIKHILDASRRMDQLTLDLLNLARLSKVTLNARKVDLGEMAHEIILELKKAAPHRQASVTIHPNLYAFGDPGLLRVVIENLLGNAWKYTSERPQARIEFGKERVNGREEFFVRDNGAGFEMAYAGKLFQPFQRLHSNASYPGNGVGLATAKRIIQRHGGTIYAESFVDQGATFRFTLQAI